MKLKAICFIMGMAASLTVAAQDRPKFHSINMAGIVAGQSGAFGTVQTINGLEYKRVFAGIGAGIDFYKNKSVPLFFDIRTDIARSRFYLFGDIGHNFLTHDVPEKEWYYDFNRYSGGSFNELGIGYKTLLGRKNYLLFSTGYSYKELSSKAQVTTQCLVAPCPVNYSYFRYGYGRVVVKAGVSF